MLFHFCQSVDEQWHLLVIVIFSPFSLLLGSSQVSPLLGFIYLWRVSVLTRDPVTYSEAQGLWVALVLPRSGCQFSEKCPNMLLRERSSQDDLLRF